MRYLSTACAIGVEKNDPRTMGLIYLITPKHGTAFVHGGVTWFDPDGTEINGPETLKAFLEKQTKPVTCVVNCDGDAMVGTDYVLVNPSIKIDRS